MDIAKDKLNGKTIEVATGMVNLFDSITPKEMAKFQRQDNQIATIITYVEQDQKPSKIVMHQIRSKLAGKIALKWDRLILKQGVLHRLYIEEILSTSEGVMLMKGYLWVCVRLLRRMYLSMYWEFFTHLQLMRGWNR